MTIAHYMEALMRIIGKACVMRHGATRYTGVFPDLADEGLPGIQATAEEVIRRFPQKPVFISSPADRTVGTALKVLHAYGQGGGQEEIQLETLLRPIAITDYKKLMDLADKVTSGIEDRLEYHRVWDAFYMESELFKSGEICEPLSSALGRFKGFLTKLRDMASNGHVLAVTHCELVGAAVVEWFGSEGGYLKPAEAVHLTFFDDGLVHAEFRGREASFRL